MVLDRFAERAGRRPGGVAFAIAGMFLCCCSETPIDALTADASGGISTSAGDTGMWFSGMGGSGSVSGTPSVAGAPPVAGAPATDGGAAGGPASCPMAVDVAWVGKFSIRRSATQLCLHAGPVTALMGPVVNPQTAYLLELNEKCDSSEWELVAARTTNAYVVRSLELADDRYMDIEFGADANGARAILYAPVTGPNNLHQQFFFGDRGGAKFEIQSVKTDVGSTGVKCISDTSRGMETWNCVPTLENQTWELVSDPCRVE